ncbi:VWA domain-containing protein [Deinococcus peraridilitoris]|uniref:Mg-chelatase subunit ChlD n=1 Tax=Deinococcus peraridilitoris (strain DSM 19664 / LMG 22246 / CIP 109416 / KR-200) TaxID=937777 RepID=L0A5M1_DEIPD|nr:VWA domain-containing protein [Deinococcus peraridilitoris]AFZ69178.1 Mg-chelatase subunit ChlD [Deinococcus peraridilitoris DSM 19664]
MSFLWPWALLALLLLPVLVTLYLRGLSRGAKTVALHPDFHLLAQAGGHKRPVRRHLPALLYLGALATALLAVARPVAPLPMPDNRTTIMLSMDVSLSMDANDIEPTRFAAAQEAARNFVRSLPRGTRVGLASFAGYSVLNAPPSSDHERVLQAIDRLELGRGTAIGAGLLEALRALPNRTEGAPADRPPAAIVLLSDGRNNREPDPLETAMLARDLEVSVYTVGLGTQEGTLSFGRGEYGRFQAGFDAETLQAIARMTGGRYYEARSAGELSGIYRSLGQSLGWTVEPREVSGVVTALAALLLIASLLASERFNRRIL